MFFFFNSVLGWSLSVVYFLLLFLWRNNNAFFFSYYLVLVWQQQGLLLFLLLVLVWQQKDLYVDSYREIIGKLVILLMHGYWSGVEQEW
jgi:hypothetical protein